MKIGISEEWNRLQEKSRLKMNIGNTNSYWKWKQSGKICSGYSAKSLCTTLENKCLILHWNIAFKTKYKINVVQNIFFKNSAILQITQNSVLNTEHSPSQLFSQIHIQRIIITAMRFIPNTESVWQNFNC